MNPRPGREANPSSVFDLGGERGRAGKTLDVLEIQAQVLRSVHRAQVDQVGGLMVDRDIYGVITGGGGDTGPLCLEIVITTEKRSSAMLAWPGRSCPVTAN